VELPTIPDLDELADLVERVRGREQLYVRWSEGPEADLPGGDGGEQCSRDSLTGVIAWVSERALRQCEQAVEAQHSPEWGPLHRVD
jgi:hypothetical protein